VFIRQDLSFPQQVVQSCHAVRQIHGNQTTEDERLIVLAAKNENELIRIKSRLEEAGIDHWAFTEPDIGNQITSIATGPIRGHQRSFFKKYRLLQAPKALAAA
jgi:hypothetical protein